LAGFLHHPRARISTLALLPGRRKVSGTSFNPQMSDQVRYVLGRIQWWGLKTKRCAAKTRRRTRAGRAEVGPISAEDIFGRALAALIEKTPVFGDHRNVRRGLRSQEAFAIAWASGR